MKLSIEIDTATATAMDVLLAERLIKSLRDAGVTTNAAPEAPAAPAAVETPVAELEPTPKRKRKSRAKPKVAEIVDEDPLGVEDGPSLDDLRASMQTLIESSGIEEVKALFAQFDAEKISDIKPEDYAAAIKLARGA